MFIDTDAKILERNKCDRNTCLQLRPIFAFMLELTYGAFFTVSQGSLPAAYEAAASSTNRDSTFDLEASSILLIYGFSLVAMQLTQVGKSALLNGLDEYKASNKVRKLIEGAIDSQYNAFQLRNDINTSIFDILYYYTPISTKRYLVEAIVSFASAWFSGLLFTPDVSSSGFILTTATIIQFIIVATSYCTFFKWQDSIIDIQKKNRNEITSRLDYAKNLQELIKTSNSQQLEKKFLEFAIAYGQKITSKKSKLDLCQYLTDIPVLGAAIVLIGIILTTGDDTFSGQNEIQLVALAIANLYALAKALSSFLQFVKQFGIDRAHEKTYEELLDNIENQCEQIRLPENENPPERLLGDIDINITRFSYSENPEKIVLKDIQCQINRGEIICVMGKSGIGKTTLARLIAGFYNKTTREGITNVEGLEGEIKINNQNIVNIPLYKLRKSIGYVLQDANYFPLHSYTYNVLYSAWSNRQDGNENFVLRKMKNSESPCNFFLKADLGNKPVPDNNLYLSLREENGITKLFYDTKMPDGKIISAELTNNDINQNILRLVIDAVRNIDLASRNADLALRNRELASLNERQNKEQVLEVTTKRSHTPKDSLGRMPKLTTDEKQEATQLYNQSVRAAGLPDYANPYDNYDVDINPSLRKNWPVISGGERQRFSLAREFAQESSIYIFDESTANLDSEIEHEILEEIKRIHDPNEDGIGSFTGIFITHRSNIPRYFNSRILFFKSINTQEGSIQNNGSTFGTHEELFQEDDEYRRHFQLQMGH